ncbi:hypothetical protein HYQ44_019079 [Verticillium longisporum]|nr:hypothetical protein HYQ44_019079 [Verticillium longisporum]
MATQTLHAHARQGSNTSSTMSMGMSYPPAPGSPTLTNPDMILPDYGGGSPDRSESPLMMWKNAHASDANYQSSSLNHFGSGPITPTTPIIYGNGTMLSDIGEVTEVESTVGKPSWPVAPRRHVTQPDSTKDTMLQPSPSVALDAMKRRAKVQQLRRASIDSTSTVTTQGNNGHFADFDDDVSVDDSNFQGDDEESVAESHIDDTTARQAKFMPLPPGQGLGMNNENRHSTVSISQKAEEILANAKKRLTTMEGNLSRARTSLDTVSTPPHSSVGSGTPSPPIARSASAATSPRSAPGHFRMRSEAETNSDNAGDYTKRSASALGAAGGYRQPLPGSQSMGDLGRPYVRSKISQQPMLSTGLEPLGEENDPQMQSKRDSAVLDAFLSPTFGPHTQLQPDKGLTRSASVMQMRDIKDQVSDLKGKISSLREQARADSLKRRSLQSLRTPSPFTHAGTDQWYAGTIKPKRSDASLTPLGRNPWNGEMESVDGERMVQAETQAALEYAIAPTPALDEQDDVESVISDYVAAQEALRAEDRLQTDSDGQEEYEDDVDDMQTEDGPFSSSKQRRRQTAVSPNLLPPSLQLARVKWVPLTAPIKRADLELLVGKANPPLLNVKGDKHALERHVAKDGIRLVLDPLQHELDVLDAPKARVRAGVTLSGLWPLFNPHSLHAVPFSDKYWCQPVVALHKTRPADMEELWRWEHANRKHEKPILYRDLFEFHHPGQPSTRADWDNIWTPAPRH